MIRTILMIMILMISSISEMISFGGGVIPGGPRDLTEQLYLLFTNHQHHYQHHHQQHHHHHHYQHHYHNLHRLNM